MAGSWRHMTTKGGQLRNNTTFTQLIENLGDAYEAAEECYGMVWYLAERVARLEAPDVIPVRAQLRDIIRRAQEEYQTGLEIGGIQGL